MLRIPILRNVFRLAGEPVVFKSKIDRHFSQQLCVSTSLLLHRSRTADPVLQPAVAVSTKFGPNSQISHGFCTESTGSKKKKQKKNPPAVEHVGRLGNFIDFDLKYICCHSILKTKISKKQMTFFHFRFTHWPNC